MQLSIIIPAFNEAELIGTNLDRIRNAVRPLEDFGLEWEQVVCDNNSTDDTAAVALAKGARVVFEPVNQISRARNTGAKAASGEWLLFIDADTYPPPGLMKEVHHLMRSGEIVGCGSTVKAYDGSTWNKLRIERLNPSMRWFNWCGGAFILCRSEAFREIAGFSTGLFALEEIDFVRRLKRYGRGRGLKFTVLHRYPVMTSARKGNGGPRGFAVLFLSTTVSVLLLLLYFLLGVKGSRKWLGFWYEQRKPSS